MLPTMLYFVIIYLLGWITKLNSLCKKVKILHLLVLVLVLYSTWGLHVPLLSEFDLGILDCCWLGWRLAGGGADILDKKARALQSLVLMARVIERIMDLPATNNASRPRGGKLTRVLIVGLMGGANYKAGNRQCNVFKLAMAKIHYYI